MPRACVFTFRSIGKFPKSMSSQTFSQNIYWWLSPEHSAAIWLTYFSSTSWLCLHVSEKYIGNERKKIQPDFSVLRLSSSGKRGFISGNVTSPDLLALTSWAVPKWPCKTACKYSLRRFPAALIQSKISRRQRKPHFFLRPTSAFCTEHIFAASDNHTFK